MHISGDEYSLSDVEEGVVIDNSVELYELDNLHEGVQSLYEGGKNLNNRGDKEGPLHYNKLLNLLSHINTNIYTNVGETNTR